MKQIIFKEFTETKQRYIKFRSRLSKKRKNGSFQKLSFSKQQQLIYRIKKLYNRLLWLKHLLRLSAAGATFSMALALQANGQTTKLQKPFKNKINSPIVNLRNYESDIFVQKTGADNPFGTENPFDGQLIPNSSYARFVDFDHDGDLDVFSIKETTSGNISYSVIYYKNIGNNTAATLLECNGANNPFNGITFQSKPYLSFVDIDNDGDLDAFTGNYGSQFQFFENTGSAFVEHQGTENPLSFVPVDNMEILSFADIDNDGDLDFFKQENVYGSYGSMLLFRNTGSADSAVFTPENADSLFLNSYNFYSLNSCILADIDNDNDLDALINGSRYFVNVGNSYAFNFIEVTGSGNPFQNVNAYSEVIFFTDVDGDSDLDLLVSDYSFFSFYQNTGTVYSAVFENKSTIFQDSYFMIPDFVDIDNDGDYDMFMAEYNYGSGYSYIQYYKNTGSQTHPVFTKQDSVNNPLSGIYSYSIMPLEFADIDMDGDADLFIGSYYNSYNSGIRFFKNIGTATNPLFEEKTGQENPLNAVSEQLCFVDMIDIDGDGDLDCFYSGYDTLSNYWTAKFLRNIGNIYSPVFQEENNYFPLNTDDIFLPDFIDVDNDGDYDCFAGFMDYSSYGWKINFYKNTGSHYSPSFQEQLPENNPLNIENIVPFISFVDIDYDGDKDCFMGVYQQILYFENKTINNPVNTVAKDNRIKVYPNPSNGVFEYNPELFGNLPVDITVTDVSGKIVTELEQISGRKIDVSYLEKGMYVLTVTNRQQIRKSKIVIE